MKSITVIIQVDDFSGEFLINPMVQKEFTNVTGGRVILENYVQLGANSIVMPNSIIGEGTVSGAFSLIKSNLSDWSIYAGIPVKFLKNRKKDLLKYVKQIH